MEETLICPTCHQPIQSTDYFCGNCGKKLQDPPPSTTPFSQFKLYAGSIFLPPWGIIASLKYLKQPNSKSKRIGMVAITLGCISLVVSAILTVNTLNAINDQVNSQLDEFGIDSF